MNQTVKRWVAVEPRPQSVLDLVSTGAVGWARMRMNQTVKRWVAVEPRPQSVLDLVSTGAVGWAFVTIAHFQGASVSGSRQISPLGAQICPARSGGTTKPRADTAFLQARWGLRYAPRVAGAQQSPERASIFGVW